MSNPTESLRESAAVVADLGGTAEAFAALGSSELTEATGAIAALRRSVDQFAAMAAGEIARRSRHELGHQGLAQRAGFVSPVAMIQAVAQVSKHEAARQVASGTLLSDVEFSERDAALGEIDPSAAPGEETPTGWRELLAAAFTEGALSLDAMDAIRRVLSDIEGADEETLASAAQELVMAAPGHTPEQLHRRARQIRDVIDAEGIERREKQQRDLRSVRTWWDSNGMHCGTWRLAPEDGALVAEAFAQVLSPRRGGPRFVDSAARATAQDLIDDPRTDEQLAADAFVDAIRLAVDADPGTLVGSRRPAVRIVVTSDRLQKRRGPGHLEGRTDAVSMSTIDRQICNTGVIAVGFDTDGQCVNVGRDQRLFTQRQRIGLAIRDGGCLFPGCERPPSYCEAHHIDPWVAASGKTDIADGVLLCRRHHLLIHDNRWQVIRDGARYLLRPPPDLDPRQELIPMPSRSPVMPEITRSRSA